VVRLKVKITTRDLPLFTPGAKPKVCIGSSPDSPLEGDGFELLAPGFVKPRYHFPLPVSPPREASLGVNYVDDDSAVARLKSKSPVEFPAASGLGRAVADYEQAGASAIWPRISRSTQFSCLPTVPSRYSLLC